MRHKNSVKQLGRTYSHRTAMFDNMVTSLFTHERIVTTKEKGKVLKRIAEKMITRAKKNLINGETEIAKNLHNKREVMKSIKNRDVVTKLFNDIAVRNKDRKGGYTRLLLLGQRRKGDAAEMAIVELVERVVVQKNVDKNEKEKKEKKDKKVIKEKEKKDKSK